MAATFVGGKAQECIRRVRDIINAFHLVYYKIVKGLGGQYTTMPYISNEYYRWREALCNAEMVLLRQIGFRVHPCVVYPLSLVASYLHALELDRELMDEELEQLEAKEKEAEMRDQRRLGQEQHGRAEHRHHRGGRERSAGHRSTRHGQRSRKGSSSGGSHREPPHCTAPSHRKLVQRIICTLNEAAYSNVFAVYSLPTIACACIDLNCTKRYQLPIDIPWYNVFDVTKDQLDACRRDIRRVQRNLVIDWKYFELAMRGRKWPEGQQQHPSASRAPTLSLEK